MSYSSAIRSSRCRKSLAPKPTLIRRWGCSTLRRKGWTWMSHAPEKVFGHTGAMPELLWWSRQCWSSRCVRLDCGRWQYSGVMASGSLNHSQRLHPWAIWKKDEKSRCTMADMVGFTMVNGEACHFWQSPPTVRLTLRLDCIRPKTRLIIPAEKNEEKVAVFLQEIWLQDLGRRFIWQEGPRWFKMTRWLCDYVLVSGRVAFLVSLHWH